MIEPPSYNAPGPAVAPRRRGGLIAALAAGAVVLVLATAGIVWLALRPAGSPATAAPQPATSATSSLFTIDGVLELDANFIWNSTADPTCHGIKGYDDITGGAQVTVTSASGKVLVVGALEPGVAQWGPDDRATSCRLVFTVHAVPGGLGPYGISVASRTAGNYAESNLVAGDVELKLG